MNRLRSELQRLYLPAGPADPAHAGMIGSDGQSRAMVLELARPADWALLSTVWQGVQADLGLPAPAIAVSGQDGVQLWFSLAQAVPAMQAAAFLGALRVRYLGGIDLERLRLLPKPDAAAPMQVVHAQPVPAAQGADGRWSAFVAQDLAPVFAEEPWLDMPPNPEGQAELLSRLKSIEPAALRRAMERLAPDTVTPPAPVAVALGSGSGSLSSSESVSVSASVSNTAQSGEPASAAMSDAAMHLAAPIAAARGPRQFLLDVMNDERVALPLRIEAAKALLPWFEGPGRP